jgi:hypothetical protein
MKKYVFWHIGNIGNGIEVAKEQYQTLLNSGLLENVDGLKIGLSGNNDEFITSILNEKISLVVQAPITECETNTSRKMVEFARYLPEDSYILFMHTKGSSRYGTAMYENGKAWRNYMEYFSIEKWRDAIAKLDSGYDSCGVEMFYDPLPGIHYSGAFFWIRSNILKQIDPAFMSMGSRWGKFCTEAIPSIIEHKRFCFFSYRDTNPSIDLYIYKAKPEDYIK